MGCAGLADKNHVALDIIRLLLVEGEDLSIREMARQLGISSALTHYHMKRLWKLGVLVRHELRDGGGYYTLQDIFTNDAESTLGLLKGLCGKVDDCSGETLGECLRLLLKCQTFL